MSSKNGLKTDFDLKIFYQDSRVVFIEQVIFTIHNYFNYKWKLVRSSKNHTSQFFKNWN